MSPIVSKKDRDRKAILEQIKQGQLSLSDATKQLKPSD
jgi:hypothetical protein